MACAADRGTLAASGQNQVLLYDLTEPGAARASSRYPFAGHQQTPSGSMRLQPNKPARWPLVGPGTRAPAWDLYRCGGAGPALALGLWRRPATDWTSSPIGPGSCPTWTTRTTCDDT